MTDRHCYLRSCAGDALLSVLATIAVFLRAQLRKAILFCSRAMHTTLPPFDTFLMFNIYTVRAVGLTDAQAMRISTRRQSMRVWGRGLPARGQGYGARP